MTYSQLRSSSLVIMSKTFFFIHVIIYNKNRTKLTFFFLNVIIFVVNINLNLI